MPALLLYEVIMQRLFKGPSREGGHGKKDDFGKLRYDLLDVNFEEEMAKVLTAGAEKYGANNWQKLEDAQNRYYAALRRHLAAARQGRLINEEDGGLNTWAQVAVNAMFLYYFTKED